MVSTNEKDNLALALDALPVTGASTRALRRAVRESVEAADPAPLLTWANAEGARNARSGSTLEDLIQEMLEVGAALDTQDLSVGMEGNMSPALVAAAVQGFNRGTGESAGGGARIEFLRGQVEELTALHRVISAANSSRKVNDMLQETANAVVAVTHADNCSVFLFEPEWDQLVLAASTDPDAVAGQVRLRVGEGITGWSAMAGIPLAVRDVRVDHRFRNLYAPNRDEAISMLAVPIVLFTIEKLVGVITIKTFEERDWSENETKFLETVAGEIAIAIENTRLYEQTDAQLRQKVAELSALQGVSAHIAATLNLSEVLSLIAHQSAHLVHADASTIYVINPDPGTLEQIAHYNLRDPAHNVYEARIGPKAALKIEQSKIAQAVIKGIPAALPPDVDAPLGIGIQTSQYMSMFCVPLVAPRGIMGAICLYDHRERVFSEEQVHLLDAFAHEAAVAIENSRLYEAAVRGFQIKSAMLQEMNHRVRNNLQTVAGLLSMQSRRMNPEGETAVALRESIARIQSMAAVHDLMMGSDVLSTSVYDIARRVTEAAVSTLLKPGFNLKLDIEQDEAENIRVDSQKATLLALLINELISNAILHGFAGRDKGMLKVRAWIDREEEATELTEPGTATHHPPVVNIEVIDNGVGLPEGFDPERTANLGLSIVRTMVNADLHGCFTIGPGRNKVGTRACISFANYQADY